MRIVHFNTYEAKGGAARSAVRLHEGLLALGVDSTLLVRAAAGQVAATRQSPAGSRFDRAYWDFVQREYVARNRTALSDTWFSSGYPGVDLSREDAAQAADVLHLHWVGNYLSPPAIAALASLAKPLVWTLHDQRPFTGGCHFSAGCRGFENDCAPCPQLAHDPCGLPARNLRDQARLWPAECFTVVAPSRWLAEAARRSVVFARTRIELIPYGIDTHAFRPLFQREARARFDLSADRPIVLFGADAPEQRKGNHLLVETFRRLPERLAAETDVVYFGRRDAQFDALGSRVRYLGYLRTTEDLRAAYAAATVFALPSLEDNLPNMMLESLACGTPVVAFASGGIPDAIEDHINGRLVPIGDLAALAAALGELLAAPARAAALGAEGARRATREGSLEVQAQRYQALYRSLSVPRAESRPTSNAVRDAMFPLFAWSLAHRLGVH